MSKESIKKYGYKNYEWDYITYYGLDWENNRLFIDVARLKDTYYQLDDIIIAEMEKRMEDGFFIPNKENRHDYVCNIFKDELRSLKKFWDEEFSQAISKIKTPDEVGEEARTGWFMQSGILEPDECAIHGMMESFKRMRSYHFVIISLYAQFIHQFTSRIEAITIKVLVKMGYKNKNFSRKEFNAFIQGLANITLEDLKNYKYYDKLYCVWNFLKHNTISTYKKVLKKYPEIIYSSEYEYNQYENGDLAVFYLKLNKEYIECLFIDLPLFFDELCQKVFKENIEEAEWNYDQFFENEINSYIECEKNPLGLPDGI